MDNPKFRSTAKYEQFDHFGVNRDVSKVQRIVDSMKRYGFLPHYPLHCTPGNDGKLVIKDGHHRFAAAQQLGLPVWYVVADDGGVAIHELQHATRAWSIQDFLTSYVRDNRAEYLGIYERYVETGIPLMACMSMMAGQLAGSGNVSNAFKSGRYASTEAGQRHFEIVASVVKEMRDVGVEHATNQNLVNALSRICSAPEVDMVELKRKIRKYPHLVTRHRSDREYLAMLEGLYNYASKERIPLVFLADEAVRRRTVSASLKDKGITRPSTSTQEPIPFEVGARRTA